MEIQEVFSGATWVGVPEEQYELRNKFKGLHGIQTAYFRHVFNLEKTCGLTMRISANSRYRLWINGRAVTSGPCKGDRWRRYYETLDVSDYLREGTNIIAVKVVYYPPFEAAGFADNGPTSIVTNAAGIRLIVGGSCRNKDEEVLHDITTGKSDWKVWLDNAVTWVPSPMTAWMGAMESVKGELLPYGWKEADTVEGLWSAAEVIEPSQGNPWAAPFGIITSLPLVERTIPLLYEKERNFTSEMSRADTDFKRISFSEGDVIQLEANSRYYIELNAGELTTGYFNLRVREGSGSRITIKYAECYSQNVEGRGIVKGVRDDSEKYSFIGHQDVYYPSGKEEIYEPFWFRTFRFVRIEIETGNAVLHLEAPWYYETGYPLEVKTEINSSTEWLAPLWDISLRTLRRCMHETYEDCPYYEQLQYTMDTRLQILFTYMTSGDTALARKAIEDYASSQLPEGILQSRFPSAEPQVIPVFALYWIMMLEDYYIQTGDSSLIKKYRAVVDSVLNWYDDKTGAQGLVEKLGYWEFMDWVKQWERGEPPAIKHGPSTTHNLVYAAALKTAARLNSISGREGIAKEYEDRAEKVLKMVEKLCWDEEAGLYREGPEFEEFSVQAQVWAVLVGLAEGNEAQDILRISLSRKEIAQCSYAMSFYLYRSLEEAGIYCDTEELWELWKDMLKMKLTTTPEDTVQPRSDCHGWGALPLYEFAACLLGVKPSAPGWEKILIEPKALSLKDMSGKVITPKGYVTVQWTIEGQVFKINIASPEDIPCTLRLPDGKEHNFMGSGSYEACLLDN
jgi:alpha-L-rhamnosidase